MLCYSELKHSDWLLQLTLVFLANQCFKNWANPASSPFIFDLFKQTIQFLQQIYVKKCPFSIRCWDLNPRPPERESLPITTRPKAPADCRKSVLHYNVFE